MARGPLSLVNIVGLTMGALIALGASAFFWVLLWAIFP